MSKYIIAIILFIGFINVYAQNGQDSIIKQKKFYYQKGQILSKTELKDILLAKPISAQEYNTYKTNQRIALTLGLGASTCCLIGSIVSLSSTLNTANELENGNLPTNEEETASAAAGLGWLAGGVLCVAVAIPFGISSKKHLSKSIQLYNLEAAKTESGCKPVKFDVAAGINRIGISMEF